MKKWIVGVKRMNKKFVPYYEELVRIIKEIPDIKIYLDEDICHMMIITHSPLEEVDLKYLCENRLWSQNYILTFQNKKRTTLYYEKRKLIFNGKVWINKVDKFDIYAKKLNDNKLLEKQMEQFVGFGGNIEVDLGKQEIEISGSMFPGMIVSLILPPITKFIVPKKKEITHLLQVMQLILNEFV